MTRRIRLGLLYGGRSGEHEVSVSSARSVLDAVDRDKYEIVPIAITREGRWLLGTMPDQLSDAAIQTDGDAAAMVVADVGGRGLVRAAETAGRGASSVVDVVFPLLHGPSGEDGTVQGLLELAQVPYVGAGVAASAVGMDKVMMKALFEHAGLDGPKYKAYRRYEWRRQPDTIVVEIEQALGFPAFVKPARLGSSVGISRASNPDMLWASLSAAFSFDEKVIVEEAITGREVECGVLGNHEPAVSTFGEILSKNEFYDYEAKYTDGLADLIIPACLTSEQVARMTDVAIGAFRAIDAAGMARVDFFLEKNTGRVVLNEINTIPGFTRTSMFPKLWEASGLSYRELIDRLVELAIERASEANEAEWRP